MKRNGRSGVNNVLITGISGFLGLNLAEQLLSKDNYNLYGIADDISPPIQRQFKIWSASGKLKFYNLDLMNIALLRKLLAKLKLDHVVHLAGYVDSGTSYEIANLCVDSNVKGTLNLLEAIKGSDVKSFIYSSTIEVYSHWEVPSSKNQEFDLTSTYAITKLIGEMLSRLYFRLYCIPVVILRFANVYGPYQKEDKLIPMSILNSLEDKDIYLKSMRGQKRDFCFVSDAIKAIISSFNNKKAIGETFDIVSGQSYSIYKLVEMIIRKIRSKSHLKLVTWKAGSFKIWQCKRSYSKANKILDWRPKVSLEDGLNQTIAWYRALKNKG